MKRFLALILAVTMAATIFGGCSSAPAKDEGKLNIVTTIFPSHYCSKTVRICTAISPQRRIL